jgi:Trk K+ transport system NAD-binding subunit
MGSVRIEEILSGAPLHTVSPTGDGEVEIYRFSVPKAWDGRLIRDLIPHEQCTAVALTRAGRSSLPKPDDKVATGDLLHLSATREAARVLREQLEKEQEG